MRLIGLLLASFFALSMSGCDRRLPEQPKGDTTFENPATGDAEPAGRLDRSFAGTPAPADAFEDPAGESVSLADFRGQPVLVNLWATWCAPCVAEMPTLDALAVREDGKILVLAVSQDLQGPAKVDAFFDKAQFSTLQPYVDPEMRLMSALKIESLPTTILYDAEGREKWRMSGGEDWMGPRAAGLLAEAVSP